MEDQVLTLDDEAITVQITQQQFEEYKQLMRTKQKLDKIEKEKTNE